VKLIDASVLRQSLNAILDVTHVQYV